VRINGAKCMSVKPIKTALLIEDNPADARLLRELFNEEGSDFIEVEHVDCMGEAERVLSEREFDIVVLDLGLPDASGLAAVQRVHKAAPRVPLVGADRPGRRRHASRASLARRCAGLSRQESNNCL